MTGPRKVKAEERTIGETKCERATVRALMALEVWDQTDSESRI